MHKSELLEAKEAEIAIVVGCDFHSRFQQVAVMDLETGELSEYRLEHEGEQVRRFYERWSEPVTVAIETTGYTLWFARLLAELGHQLRVGDAAQLRAMAAARAGSGTSVYSSRPSSRRAGPRLAGFSPRSGVAYRQPAEAGGDTR